MQKIFTIFTFALYQGKVFFDIHAISYDYDKVQGFCWNDCGIPGNLDDPEIDVQIRVFEESTNTLLGAGDFANTWSGKNCSLSMIPNSSSQQVFGVAPKPFA